MIRTEREYQEALRRLAQDEQFLAAQTEALRDQGLRPAEVERATDPTRSFGEQLKEEIEWYEGVRRGEVEPITNLSGLGPLLIALRIASGWSQRELAASLGVSEAQVSRDERNEYHGITLERAQRVIEALRARVKTEVVERDLEAAST